MEHLRRIKNNTDVNPQTTPFEPHKHTHAVWLLVMADVGRVRERETLRKMEREVKIKS